MKVGRLISQSLPIWCSLSVTISLGYDLFIATLNQGLIFVSRLPSWTSFEHYAMSHGKRFSRRACHSTHDYSVFKSSWRFLTII